MADKKTDEALVQAHLSGDPKAFEELFKRYHPRLLGFALKRLGNYTDAEDAVAETWLTYWQKIRDFQPTRKFSSWLYGICLNKCYKERGKKHRKLEVPYPEAVRYDPDDVLQTSPRREIDFGRIKSFKLREAAQNKQAREWCLAVLNHRQHRLFDLVMVQGRRFEAVLQEKDFCPVPPGVPLEIKDEHIEKLRIEFAEIMEIVNQRSKERVRRDRKAYRKEFEY